MIAKKAPLAKFESMSDITIYEETGSKLKKRNTSILQSKETSTTDKNEQLEGIFQTSTPRKSSDNDNYSDSNESDSNLDSISSIDYYSVYFYSDSI